MINCRKRNDWLAKKVDSLIERLSKAENENSVLNTKVDGLMERSCKAESENSVLKTKVELYEKFIAKMLESDPDKSNDVFMLDGEIYRLAGYEIQSEPGEQKVLTAEFHSMKGITKNFKGES